MDPRELNRLADATLERLRFDTRRAFSTSELAALLSTSEGNIAAALPVIEQWGYRLSREGGRLALVFLPDTLTSDEITAELTTLMLGRRILAYRQVKSTNAIAYDMAARGAPEGTIVVADEQTAGKGRLGRSWHSPPGAGIYVSIILRPTLRPDRAPSLSLMAGLALAGTLARKLDRRFPDVAIKWPNDVLLGGRKCAGILTELAARDGRTEFVIMGVGINVLHAESDFPEDLRHRATSVLRETGVKLRRPSLLAGFLVELERIYSRSPHGLSPEDLNALRGYSSLIGRLVRLRDNQREVEGQAVDIDISGALVVETADGVRHISGGEVTVVKSEGRQAGT